MEEALQVASLAAGRQEAAKREAAKREAGSRAVVRSGAA